MRPDRRRHLALIITALAGLLALIWPVFPMVPWHQPRVLGLPAALAWIVLWLLILTLALVPSRIINEKVMITISFVIKRT